MNTTPHLLVITCDGTDVDWTHPADCADDQHCEILRRTSHATLNDMADLAAGRPDGTYRLGLYGFNGLCLTDDTGHLLADAA
jgi:hypothetical protein